jgi:hypothetical protein
MKGNRSTSRLRRNEIGISNSWLSGNLTKSKAERQTKHIARRTYSNLVPAKFLISAGPNPELVLGTLRLSGWITTLIEPQRDAKNARSITQSTEAWFMETFAATCLIDPKPACADNSRVLGYRDTPVAE